MISEETLLALIAENLDYNPGFKHMIASVCRPYINESTGEDVLIEKIKQITTIEHKASTHSDDDEHWAIKSPFNGKWYLFASMSGGGWPQKPDSIEESLPKFFNEDF